METKIFQVEGMSCQHCVKNVTNALQELTGVTSVSVSLEDKKVTVTMQASAVTDEALKLAIEDAGYDVV